MPAPQTLTCVEYPWWQSYKNETILNIQYEDLLTAVDCTDLNCLRGLDYSTLSNATSATYKMGHSRGLNAYGDLYFSPYVDGFVIQDLPSREYERRAWSEVPLLVDHNAYEGW